MDKLNGLERWVLQEIIKELKGMQGVDRVIYTSSLTHELFSVKIANGSYTCSSYYASEWIKHFFDDLGEVLEDMETEGIHLDNPFTSPERFQLEVILYMTNSLLWRSKAIRTIKRVEEDESTPQVFTVSLIQEIIDDFTDLLDA